MYATRLGMGSGVEPGERRSGTSRRRIDYGVVRVPRASGAPARDRRRVATWRRVVRGAVLAGLVLVALGLAAARSVEGSEPPSEQTIVVRQGDTIWSLASHHYPNSDPRTRVEQIEQLNHLNGPAVRPGERLQLPPR